MSITSRNNLKTEFISGTAATQAKFNDLIDSSYNTSDDSILIGPLGMTGSNGLVGPSGATSYNGLIGPGIPGNQVYPGLWISPGPTPALPSSVGSTGQVVFDTANAAFYICLSTNNWIQVKGSTSF